MEFENIGLDFLPFNYDCEDNANEMVDNQNTHYVSHDDLKSMKKDVNDSLSIMHFNARSLPKNFENIENLLHYNEIKLSVIGISETWLTDNCNKEYYSMLGYNGYYTNRNTKKGGGTALYVRSDMSHTSCLKGTYSIDNCFEVTTVRISLKQNKEAYVSCIYKPPNTNIDEFITKYTEFLNKFKGHTLYICGDFNIDLMKYNEHVSTGRFLELNYSYNMYPLIIKPTRITEKSATLIDNIITNDLRNKMKNFILIDDITDHLPVFTVIANVANYKSVKGTIEKRSLTIKNVNKLKCELVEHSWHRVLQCENADQCYEIFIKDFVDILDRCCKMVKSHVTHKNVKPWLTTGLINACKKKNSMYKRWLIDKSQESESRYKKYKNKLVLILRKAEREYYKNELNKHKKDVKATWSILNNIIKKGRKQSKECEFMNRNNKKVYDKQTIANMFNDFYINVGPKLASGIDTKHVQLQYDTYLKDIDIEKSMFILPCTEEEVSQIINNFKNKTSQDVNGISMKLVKELKEYLIEPLTHICNKSLLSGVFPNKMKTAKVLPLFKSNDEHNVSNYRPVSILPQFSKVLEKLYEKRLRAFIDKNNLLFSGQYGFRTNRSTSLALNELIDTIVTALGENKFCIGVFIDLKKAFDTVDHTLLIQKFKYYGVRGICSKFLDSYLSNRKQYVNYGSHVSEEQIIKCGVPQGSILGPLLFIMYINDMYKVSEILRFIIFADDTNLFCLGDDLSVLVNTVNIELKKLESWFKVNKLSLNVSKSNYMLFGNKKSDNYNVQLSGINLEKVVVTKFLGVLIDYQLNWNKHIQNVRFKVSKVVGIMYKIRHKVDSNILLMIYNSLILPYLTYCIDIWGNTYKSRIRDLILLQKRAVRIIDNAGYRDHTTSIFRKYKLLKLEDIIHLQTCILMYKADKGTLPGNIQQNFQKNKDVHCYNTRSKENFFAKQTTTKMVKMSINFKGKELWNALPKNLKNSASLSVFKKRLKNHMLNNY